MSDQVKGGRYSGKTFSSNNIIISPVVSKEISIEVLEITKRKILKKKSER